MRPSAFVGPKTLITRASHLIINRMAQYATGVLIPNREFEWRLRTAGLDQNPLALTEPDPDPFEPKAGATGLVMFEVWARC